LKYGVLIARKFTLAWSQTEAAKYVVWCWDSINCHCDPNNQLLQNRRSWISFEVVLFSGTF